MINKYPDFWKIILGGGTAGAFLAYVAIAFVCVVISVLIDVSKRDVASPNSPVKFSWKFMLAANLPRFVANILAIPILIRLIYEYVDPKWMVLLAVVIGIMVDQLANWLKNLGILTANKITEKIKDQVGQNDHIIQPKDGQ
jgi:hypothetical protein